jgi:hypothetical protein
MPTSREMRERLTPSSVERSGLLTTVFVGIVAFAIGAAAIVAWKMFPASTPPAVAGLSEPAVPKFTGNRLGRAEFAPLLRTCVKSDLANGMTPEVLYTFLTAAGTMGRIAPLFGSKEFDDRGQLTVYWNMIADCVYQQNSWHLCDLDNRALAVASASAFIRSVATQPAGKSRTDQIILGDNARAAQRVLDTLRMRVRNGQLIAADFGPLPPPEIKTLLTETKTIANGCEKP